MDSLSLLFSYYLMLMPYVYITKNCVILIVFFEFRYAPNCTIVIYYWHAYRHIYIYIQVYIYTGRQVQSVQPRQVPAERWLRLRSQTETSQEHFRFLRQL